MTRSAQPVFTGSPVNPDVVYATVEASQGKGGFFRSPDRGETWERRSGYFARSAQYYAEIVPDPKQFDRVYAMDVYMMVTDDGGKSFRRLGEKSKHVDNHALWIDPDDTDHYVCGGDGGLYESFDRAEIWRFLPNLPVTQFYRVAVDNSTPFYYVYGGTQDNATLGGPSRTTSVSGIANADWFITVMGDGFGTQVDPTNPDIVYSMSQYGEGKSLTVRAEDFFQLIDTENQAGKGDYPREHSPVQRQETFHNMHCSHLNIFCFKAN